MRFARDGAANAALLMAALHSSVCAAQVSDPAPSPAAAAALPTSTQLTDIIVTAQRRSENLARTPVAVSVISSEQLARQAITSQSDLQTSVPGLLVKAGGNSDQLNYAIRGQSLDAFSGVRPGVLPYFNEVQVSNGGSTGFYDLSSVQVLKGPQGTLFGRNATGGAVLFSSAKPTNDFGGYAAVRGGNYALFQAEGAVNLPLIDDKVLLRVAGFLQRRNGFQRNLFDGERVGKVRREGGRASLTFKPVDGVVNETVVDYSRSGGSSTSGVINTIYPTGSTNAPAPANFLFTPAIDSLFGPGAFASYLAAHPHVDPDGIVAFTAKQRARGPYVIDVDSPNFYRARNLVFTNTTTLDISDNVQLKNIFGYTHLVSHIGADLDGSPYTVDQRGPFGANSTIQQFSDELQVLGKAFDRRLSYVAGLYYSDERNVERDLSVIFDIAPLIQPNNQINSGITKSRSYAGYAQGTLDLSDLTGIQGLGATVGGRFTSEKASLLHRPDDVFILSPQPFYITPQSDTFKRTSWQVGLQEQLNPNLLFYVTSRRSFRSGGFNFFAAPVAGFGNDGGSEYKPETATDVELGTKYQGNLGGIPTRFNIAAYNLWVKDIQRVTYVLIAGAPAAVTVNVPRTRIRGIEADGLIKPASWLSLGGNVNYTDARFTRNQVQVLGNPAVAFGPFPDVAKWTGGGYVEVAAPLRANLTGSARADVYSQSSTVYSSTTNTLNPGSRIPGYALVNLRVGVADDRAGWSLTANLKNVFNKVYYVGGLALGNLFTLNTLVPGDPRTFMIEARVKF